MRPIRDNYDSQKASEDALINYGKELTKKPKPEKKVVSYYLRSAIIEDIDNLSSEYKLSKTALIEEAVLDWKSRKLF